ncbi:MAG: flagellar biosynthesis protein FlhA [Planctomycetota bacterium]
MATAAQPAIPSLASPSLVKRLRAARTLLVPIAFIALLGVIVVPMPPAVMDILLSANLALAAVILLTTIYVTSPLDFSVLPSLLLGTTLFRLVLNIATTRMILSADAATPEQAEYVAGSVIATFASLVVGGGDDASTVVVGVILFIILIIVQFVVITKGSTRISEVAARFTLDGMPGKQMAIDADLNAGLIDEQTAKSRREEISREADFYGAMDGAAKFVRGDAIAGIIITIVNIIGGLLVGIALKGWSVGESVELFTRLTVGDGLVSQLPAFVISIAAGLIVTRSSSKSDLSNELTRQLMSRGAALGITSGFLAAMGFLGLPMLPMLMLSAALGTAAWVVHRADKRKAAATATAEAKAQAAAAPETKPVEQALKVDTLELEVGYQLVRMVDTTQGGDLLDRVSSIRRQLAGEMGIVMPPVRIRDNMQLAPHGYALKVRGNTVASGQVFPGQFLAMDSGLASEPLPGTKTREPAFGLEATWIEAGQKQRAETLGYTVVDATSVLSTHITEVVKTHSHELLTREETNHLIEQLKESAPKLVEEVLGGEAALVKPGELQRVLQNLLKERVSIRDLETIVETLGDWAPRTKDLDVLTEYVRNALRRTICSQYVVEPTQEFGDDGTPALPKLYCVSLDPALEDRIAGFVERSGEGTSMSMPPAVANRITSAIVSELDRLTQGGHHPVVLASPQVRAQVRILLEPHLPAAAVLGYNEVSKGVDVESLGMASLGDEGNQAA